MPPLSSSLQLLNIFTVRLIAVYSITKITRIVISETPVIQDDTVSVLSTGRVARAGPSQTLQSSGELVKLAPQGKGELFLDVTVPDQIDEGVGEAGQFKQSEDGLS